MNVLSRAGRKGLRPGTYSSSNKTATLLSGSVMAVAVWLFFLPAHELLAQGPAPSLIEPYRLRCEGALRPLAVGDKRFSLTWSLRFIGDVKPPGTRQAYYQVRIWSMSGSATADTAPFFDSGRIQTSSQVFTAPSSLALKPRRHYRWDVRVWDHDGGVSRLASSEFRMAGETGDAIRGQWIGPGGTYAPLLSPPEGFLSSTIAEQSDQHVIVVDLGDVFPIDEIRLVPARPFRAAVDIPGIGFPLRFEVAISRSARKSDAQRVYSCLERDYDGPAGEVLSIPLSRGWGRFVAIRTEKRFKIGLRSFVALGEIEVLSRGKNVALKRPVVVTDEADGVSYDPSFLVDGRLPQSGIDRSADGPATEFRRQFVVEGSITRALFSFCCLGALDLRINGRHVNEAMYGSARSDYDKRAWYQTVDVTPYLRPGKNEISCLLGHGIFASRVPDVFLSERSAWKKTPRLIAELEYTDAKGTRSFGSDASWRMFPSSVIDQGFRNGETHDVRRQRKSGGNGAQAQDAFEPARLVGPIDVPLTPQKSPPISIIETIDCVAVRRTGLRTYLVDFGENIAGTFDIRFHGPAGDRVVIDAREQLKEDGSLDLVPSSWAVLGRYQHYECVLSGENDRFFPRLSRAGFRYLQVKLPPGTAMLSRPRAYRTGTRFEPALTLSCRHEGLTRLREVALRTLESCCQSTPVDSPQRERLGWLLDGCLAADAYMTEWDAEAWIEKWIDDILDAQNENGFVPSVVPGSDLFDAQEGASVGHFADPWWGGTICFLPWKHYLRHGDWHQLRRAWPGMKKWISLLEGLGGAGVSGWGLGDWHEPHGTHDPSSISLVATMGYYRAALVVSQVAAELGEFDEASRLGKLAGVIRDSLLARFPVDEAGFIDQKRQAPQALALWNRFLEGDEEKAMLRNLRAQLFGAGECRLDTGYVATQPLLSLLHEAGDDNDVLRVLLNRSEASWINFVEQGMSTFPERWQPPSDSLNHLPLAAVDSAITRLLGVPTPMRLGPGYKRFRIWPRAMKAIGAASWNFESQRGPISCEWTWGSTVEMRVGVPCGSWADVILPISSLDEVEVNGARSHTFQRYTPAQVGNSATSLTLPAGGFTIRFPAP